MLALGHEMTEKELQDTINELDVDGTGSIEWEEFATMMVEKREKALKLMAKHTGGKPSM